MQPVPVSTRVRLLRDAVASGLQAARVDATYGLLRRSSPGFDRAWGLASAVPGWLPDIQAAGLYAVVQALTPTTIVELGSYLGRSTVLFAAALDVNDVPGTVVAVDPHTGDRQHLEKLGIATLDSYGLFLQHVEASGLADRIEPVRATSLEAAASYAGAPVDFLYVDGWHSFDAVVADGEAWARHLAPGAAVVFDDVATYAEVAAAVVELDRRGVIHTWSPLFGQVLGGPSPEPPAALLPLMRFISEKAGRWLGGR